jgi:hypothetical protein
MGKAQQKASAPSSLGNTPLPAAKKAKKNQLDADKFLA